MDIFSLSIMNQEETDIEEIRRENVELLTEISQLCSRKDRTRVENIFLLGKIGAGKSALVNTVIRAIAGKNIPKAKVGQGRTQSKTFTLERFESCGVTEEDITDETQRDLVLGMLNRLPTILDAAGRGDNDTSESLMEILELCIGGYIPPGTSIEAVEALQEKYGVGALKDTVFTKSQDDRKVTKVVYVQSGREKVSEDLVNCLQKVLRKTDPETLQPLYTGEIYVVITKYDLVKHDCSSDDENEHVTLEAFEREEKNVADLFNIQGALKDNMIRWVSYTDTVDTDDPKIDNTALKFIKRMVTPGNRQRNGAVVKPVITRFTEMKLEARRWWRNQNFTLPLILLIIIGLLLAIVMYMCLTATPTN
ncbi:uncharacterized protein LOC123560126 isoform X2 [Mercenaria mercenaria]|uniref:uncharacterized protein LOC123560126 isoform X2 n=1 Tax=Mercenaria mercenaria TaxID=6596 RepID=UPI00234EB891|nr:uncharacterized protein LOC123560126 isoform X2 [Mercenaria mercenaria]